MQNEGEQQRIRWQLGPVTPALHSKVSRTYSVCGPSLTNNALLLAPRRDLPVDVRSSPDGSAGNSDERQPTIVNKRIDEDPAAAVTLRDFNEMSASGCESRGKQPEDAVPHGWSHNATGSGQPCPQQEDSLHLSVTDGPVTEGDAKSSPVASESRDELLKCETGTFALEDVLRHYWLLSDHDDDAKLRREPVYSQAFDWLSKRSPGTAASYLESKSSEPSTEVDQGVASSFQYERDEDADSIVTLSTISEEDSEEISSADASHRVASLFGNTEPKFRNGSDQNDDDDADILKESENFVGKFEGFSGDDLSAVLNDDETSSDNSEIPEIRIPDGLESEVNEFSYSSNAFDSLLRTFSRYVSDVYPFSPAFISHQASLGGEGRRRTTLEGEQGAENPQDTYKEARTQLKDDNRGKLQLVLQDKDSLKNNSAASDDSTDRWHTANGSGNVSTIASPMSWYTVSDVFDAQSFETASENMGEDGDAADAGVSTAFAKCTAFLARYHDTEDGTPDAKFRSSVTARVTAEDPIVALSKAAARAATLAAAEVVRSCDRCPGNIEVALTATCAMASQFGDLDNDDVQLVSKSDVAFEKMESHAAIGAHHVNSLSMLEDSSSISTKRFNSTTTNTRSDAATKESMPDLDHEADGEFSCGVAIPHTRNAEISKCIEFDVGSVADVEDFPSNPDKCEATSVADLDCAKNKKSRSRKDNADVEIVLSGIKIVTGGDNYFQTSDVVDSALTNSTMKNNSLSAGIQTANNRSNCCTTHDAVKLENFSKKAELDREKMEADYKKSASRSTNERLEKTSKSSHQMTRSLSHLLETDIDTLEHRRTEVSRNCSVSSVPDCKSYTNLILPQQESDISNDFCLRNSLAPSFTFNKEALEDMLSDSPPVRYFTKKQSSWSSNSPTEGHYASEPNLQPSVGKGRDSSSGGKVEKRYGNADHSFDGVLSGKNDKASHKCSAERIKVNIASPQRDENSSTIVRYERSPSLRRRSLSVLGTPSSGRYGVPGTTPEMQRRLGEGQTRTRTPDSRCRSLRPVSSSFENLVDSLLGITAIMSMETAVSHSRPLFASKGPEIRGRGDSSSENSSPLSIQRRCFATRSLPRHETCGNQGSRAPLATLSDCSDSVQTSPVHSVRAPRKRVHFRKAKHIFRKCSFCIEGNDRKATVSPTRNRTAVIPRKDANGTAKSH